MIEQLFATKAVELTHQKPLGAHLAPYANALAQEGYASHSIRNHIVVIADFNRWLHRRHIELPSLESKAVDQFVQYHHRQTGISRGDAGILNKFLAMLGQMGVLRHQGRQRASIRSPQQDITDEFRRYLLEQRGLAEATLRYYVSFTDQFLSERFRKESVNLSALRATDVTAFVRTHVHQLSVGRAKLLVTALRSFCRYLRSTGEIALDLAACIPTVPNWSKATLPKFLPPGTVQRILRHCDRKTSLGRRDYAILLLLAQLGLRAGEVVALSLEDINWEVGQMTIHGKGGRSAQMPLPTNVGKAIAGYLYKGRPQCSSRRVFIRDKAPVGGFANSVAICCIVMRALERAGVESPRKGAHLFRHTLACDLLRQGRSLDEIGELLRHQSPNTTEIYAKVDLTALRSVALPWPGGSR